MFQVRIHGSGGESVVSAAEILSVAAKQEGLHAHIFPGFGSERVGLPLVASCHIAEQAIGLREPVMQPDAVILQDPALLEQRGDLFSDIRPCGYILINSPDSLAVLGCDNLRHVFPAGHVRTVPATELALARMGRALPNAVLLGAFAGLTGEISFESIATAMRDMFSARVAEASVCAARAGFEAIARSTRRQPVGGPKPKSHLFAIDQPPHPRGV